MAGKLLDNAHDKIEKRNSELIAKMDKKVTLLVDGWQNSAANRHYVVMMLATSDDQEVFFWNNTTFPVFEKQVEICLMP